MRIEMSKKLSGWDAGGRGRGNSVAGRELAAGRTDGNLDCHTRGTHRDDERGQVISTLILTIPVLLLIFLVFFIFTTSQSASVAQVSADAAVIHIQEILRATHPQELPDELRPRVQPGEDLHGLLPLPEDDPTTFRDERKEAFIELVTSDWLIEVGRREVYSRMCASSRWIVGDACFDWGTNIPSIRFDPPDPDDPPGPGDPPPREPCPNRPMAGEERDIDVLDSNWPDVKVWISFPNKPLPVLGGTNDCFSNPLDSVTSGSPEWNDMLQYPIERWRIVVLVELRPVMPALITFIAEQPVRRAISCGPLFLSGDPELWKC